MFKIILLNIIKGYQFFISPWLGKNCRFYPSCSDYAKEAITKHGAIRGLILIICRLVRCNPFCKGGFDPVNKP